MRRTWNLPPASKVEAASKARQEFIAFLELWADERIPADYGAATIIFGELVDNALRHGGDPIAISVESGPSHALLTVEDAGPCFTIENVANARGGRSGGRGIRIATALARSLRVGEYDGVRCRVIAELPVRLRTRPPQHASSS